MANFTPGSNRERIYNLLSNVPITVAEIEHETGIAKGPIKSVLHQIEPLGHSKKLKTAGGDTAWVRGKGKPVKQAKTGSRSGIGKKIKEYIKNRVGHEIAIESLVIDLKLESSTFPYKIIKDYEKQGHVTVVDDIRPYHWLVNPSINSPDQKDMLPTKDAPPKRLKSPPQHLSTLQPPAIIPNNSPMETSSAISAIMQTENQNIMYRQGLMQLLALYEQQGNVLEALGLLED